MSEHNKSDDKDLPLRDDIRLLGRILGDTVRAQEGEAVFDLVEAIRQCSIRFRRHEDHAARRELEATLDSLSRDQTIDVVRAFSYFSHLANLAEDQHHIRRSRAHQIAGSAPREGSLAHALARAFDAGMGSAELIAFFETANVVPVLTAHPTEVQRKSILNCQMAIARLLDERDRLQLTPEERQANDEALRRAVLTLWQTRMLRTEKLSVMDEVSNGLSYFDYSFLRELPRLYANLEDRLASRDRSWGALELPSFMQVGSWIGGDRDGNPFVTAEILEKALATQAEKALTFYMDEVHTLGSQLSVAQGLVSASDALLRLAAASPDGSPHRSDEPYRRALTGIYARLAATYADEFNLPFSSLDDTRAAFDRVRAACEARDRDPDELVYSAAQVVCVGADEAEVARRAAAIGRQPDELRANGAAGTPDEVVARLRAFAELGATRAYLQVLDLGDLDHLALIAEEVVPHLP